ncbi:MAG: 6-phosphogluconolactonase [Pseudomonadota bacterium]
MRIETFLAAELAPALATQVAEDLIAALDRRGRDAPPVSLAVPGGTTPVFFLKALGRVDLDWRRVCVTLTDERWVPEDHPRSNQRLLCETLLAGDAGSARLVPLHRPGQEPEAALPGLAEDLRPLLPLDIVVLGMGEDMHTASLFPDADGLKASMAPEAAPVAVMRPEGQEARVTLTAPVITGAGQVYLLIKGAAKRAALERALALDDPLRAPVSLLSRTAREAVVFYAD